MAMFHLDLQQWSIIMFGYLGTLFSILVYLAPLPIFGRIIKEKSTMLYHCFPYVVTLLSSMLWMYDHGFIHTYTRPIITFHSLGCVIETIYIIIFVVYAGNKLRNDTAKLVGIVNVGVFLMIVIFTYYPLKGDTRVSVLRWIHSVVSVCVFAAPLSVAFQVVRIRSAEFLPFPLSCCITLSAFMWFCFGLLMRDLCIALPNGLGLLFGMLQMLLYGMYRNPKKEPRQFRKSEVHPVGDLEKNGNIDDGEVVYVEEGNKKERTSEEEK